MKYARHKGMIRVVRMTAAQRDRQVARERSFWQRQLAAIATSELSPCMQMLLLAKAEAEKNPLPRILPEDLPF